jgi:prepilin-type N-terminal cleavage/methylation domain-containing protein
MNNFSPNGKRTKSRLRCTKAFTLVEVMVASAIFAIGIVAIMLTVLNCFRLSMQIRYQDRAGAILRTLADQFQNGSCRLSDRTTLKTFFTETGTDQTGTGMGWSGSSRTFVFAEAADTSATPPDIVGTAADGLVVSLGTIGDTGVTSNTVSAVLTRQVRYIDPTTGVAYTTTPAEPPAGYLAKATFRATFNFRGRPFTASTTALRNLNPSDR